MLLGFIRYFRGSVGFKVTGKAPERFLNISAQRGINIWGARPVEKGIEGSMSVSDYRKIRPIAKKSGVRSKITVKRGLPFIAARFKPRIGIPIGAALGVALLIFLSNFIWTIDIIGEKQVSETALKSLLADSGVHIGAYKKTVDTGQAKRDILLKVDKIGWLSVNIVGSHVNVEIKEIIEKPELENTSPCNLKASADGVITKVTAGEGIAQVKVGSGVAKGDLLISGVNLTSQNTVRYVRAKGEVLADIISDKELRIPKSFDYNSVTENKIERRQLSFLGAHIPCSISFSSFDSAVCTQSDGSLSINGVDLPLGFVTQTERELKSEKVSCSKKTAESVFKKDLMLYEIFEKGGSRLVSKNYSISESSDGYICKARYVFNGNIAESVDFTVQE